MIEAAVRNRIVRWIWIYLILLIFEGALRKWIFPGYASVLLIIRDPVVIFIYFLALHHKVFHLGRFLITLIVIAIISLWVALFTDNYNLYVILYGFRCNFLHLPLIFVMASFLSYREIMKMGEFLLVILFPMSILMMIQLFSSPDNWINAGAGAEVYQLRATVDNVRPPGVFSYITGIGEYFAIATSFIVYFSLHRKRTSKSLLIFSIIGLIMGALVSISRLTLSGVLIVIAISLLSLFFQPSGIRMHLIGLFILILSIVLILNLNIAQKALNTFNQRIDEASNAEGGKEGYMKRISDTLFKHFESIDDIPWQGYGLGMGTAAGAQMMTGEVGYLLSEDEIGRLLFESGPIAGLSFVMWRFILCFWLMISGLLACMNGYHLPILLWGASAPMLLISQLGRPTSLGFTVFITGLCLTSLYVRPPKEDVEIQRFAA